MSQFKKLIRLPAPISPSSPTPSAQAQCASVSVHISGSMSIQKRRQQQNNVRDDVVASPRLASHRSRAYVVCIFEILVTQPQPQQSVTFTTRLCLPSTTARPPLTRLASTFFGYLFFTAALAYLLVSISSFFFSASSMHRNLPRLSHIALT